MHLQHVCAYIWFTNQSVELDNGEQRILGITANEIAQLGQYLLLLCLERLLRWRRSGRRGLHRGGPQEVEKDPRPWPCLVARFGGQVRGTLAHAPARRCAAREAALMDTRRIKGALFLLTLLVTVLVGDAVLIFPIIPLLWVAPRLCGSVPYARPHV